MWLTNIVKIDPLVNDSNAAQSLLHEDEIIWPRDDWIMSSERQMKHIADKAIR